MSNQLKTILKSITILTLFAVSVQALAVWTNPTGVAPANNTEPPINTSLTGQKKDGALIVGGLRSDTSVIGVENALFGALDIPNTSSVLELRSTTKGFLPPRMNLAQRNSIPTPATGLLIYQTDNAPGLYYFDGTNWLAVGSGSNGGGNGGGGTGLGGSGTPNTIAKWTAVGTLGDSSLTDNGAMIIAGSDFDVANTFIGGTIVLTVDSNNNNNLVLDNAVYFMLNTLSVPSVTTIHGFSSVSGSHVNDRVVYITNQSSEDSFTIKNNSATCAPQNRVASIDGGDIILNPRETVMLIYDAGYPGGARWRELFGPQ